jgi:hypothetical protein
MRSEKKGAAALAKATAPRKKNFIKCCKANCTKTAPGLSTPRAERIAEHRQDMPRQFRRVYDVAMTGRSLRAAINSQCIECMGYVFKEVKLCCSPQCPLFPYRPVQGISYNVAEPVESGAGRTNAKGK